MKLFLSMFIAYLIGSIPTGYLFAKYRNIDLRHYGSGSVGATNVFRAVGKLAALATLIIDVLKGFIVVTFIAEMIYTYRMNVSYNQFQVILAICAVAGHNWPLFLSFKGGKGIATSAGILLALCPKALLVGFCVWLVVFIFTKIVSISSLISAVSIPISSYVFGYGLSLRLLTIGLAALAIIRHMPNIRRLVKKEEKKIVC
ncbi:MAG: glycerol-3-phosphate 1-O-acyltransferase PlsY [Candidatus Omnitrophica bacterium]|nr:glycerol-3-phosphate 1-O-acyltransferase PlsY [Candidatus Omnitrophota bacterium]